MADKQVISGHSYYKNGVGSMSLNLVQNKKRYIHIAIMFALMIGIGYLPKFGVITELGMKVLGVFVGIVYGWCFIDLTWVSVFGLVMLSATGYIKVLPAMMAGFSNNVVVTIIIVCVFGEYLKRIGVTEVIAYWVLSKKMFLGRPWLLVCGMVVISIVVGLLGASFAGVFLLWGIVEVVTQKNGIEKGNVFLSTIYALVIYGVMIMTSHIPFRAAFLTFSGFFTQATGLTISAGHFFIIGIVYTILVMTLFVLIAKFVLKVDASMFIMTEELQQSYTQYKASRNQKLALWLVLIYFLALVLPSFLGSQWGFCKVLNDLGIVGISIIYMFIFAVLGDDKGKSLVDMTEAFKYGVAWPTVLLIVVTIPLGDAMGAESVGITATINAFCIAHLSGLNVLALTILALFVVGFLTQFLHNLVVAMIFIPILTSLTISMGGNPYVMFFAIHSALTCAFATPAGSPQASLIFGHGSIPSKHSYLNGWVLYFCSCIITIVLLPFVNFMLPY